VRIEQESVAKEGSTLLGVARMALGMLCYPIANASSKLLSQDRSPVDVALTEGPADLPGSLHRRAVATSTPPRSRSGSTCRSCSSGRLAELVLPVEASGCTSPSRSSSPRLATHDVYYILLEKPCGAWSLGDWERRKGVLRPP